MYVILDEYLRVREIIPEIDEKLPGVSILERFPLELIETFVYVEDGTDIAEGYKFNEETGIWEYLEISEEPIITYKNNLENRITDLENENKLLKEQNKDLTEQMELYENCLMELAEIIYA